MRRLISVLSAAALVLAIAACDADETPTDMTGRVTDTSERVTGSSEPEVTSETLQPVTETQTTVPQTTAPYEAPVTELRPADYPTLMYTADELSALDNTKYGWGQGVHVDALNRPTACTSRQNTYGKYGAIFIMPEDSPAYLTFDLGYEYGCTGRILDVLKEKNVKGTFFVTMHYVKSAPELVRRMIDEGHTVANHSVNHRSMPGLSLGEMENEIMELHNYVKDNFGYEMFLFRPPMGEHSVRSLAAAQNLGYTSVFWSYTYLDYDVNNQPSPESAYELVTRNAHKGAVYLLHGVSETNTAILGDLIDYLRSADIGIADGWR